MKCYLFFSYLDNHVGKFNEYHRIEQPDLHIAHTYVLLNSSEVIPYIQIFEVLARAKYPRIIETSLSKYCDREFAISIKQ